jgi:hypothetical protein
LKLQAEKMLGKPMSSAARFRWAEIQMLPTAAGSGAHVKRKEV